MARLQAFGMVFLIIAEFSVAVAAEDGAIIIKGASGEMMEFQRAPIDLATNGAAGIVAEAIEGILATGFAPSFPVRNMMKFPEG